MKPKISEIQLIPVKPQNGLVAFASFVLDNYLFLSSIGVVTRPNGGYRLMYPTKRNLEKNFPIFHPITKELGSYIEEIIVKKYEEVMKDNDRHSSINNTSN